MARLVPKNVGRIQIVEARCPICKTLFKGQYCPTCGLPISTTQNKRPEFTSYKEYQLCDSCDTINPFEAKYCKKCGKEISLHAKDKNGHGWVDLGLSVLWSTKALSGSYFWNYNRALFTDEDRRYAFEKWCNKEYKEEDIATAQWGEKWRTPTKDEFEELFNLCKWEKCLEPISNECAFKVVGPNGNSIIISKSEGLIESPRGGFRYWTSTSCSDNALNAYGFWFTDWFQRLCNLCSSTSVNEKIEYLKSKQFSFNQIFEFIKEIQKNKQTKCSLLEESQIVRCLEEIKNINIYSMRADVILDQKRKELYSLLLRLKEDEKQMLWIETPIFNCNNNCNNKIKKVMWMSIRPVADKKWQGRL